MRKSSNTSGKIDKTLKHWGYGSGIEQTAISAKVTVLSLDNLETSPSQKKQQDCCQCYCEKCRDCYRQPCKIHKPSQKKSIEQECKCDTNIFCPIHQPPQKKDKRTYEETLETVRKLSKLMQKEWWEKYVSTNYPCENRWTVPHVCMPLDEFKSLLKEERERIREKVKEMSRKKLCGWTHYEGEICTDCDSINKVLKTVLDLLK